MNKKKVAYLRHCWVWSPNKMRFRCVRRGCRFQSVSSPRYLQLQCRLWVNFPGNRKRNRSYRERAKAAARAKKAALKSFGSAVSGGTLKMNPERERWLSS